MPSRITADGQTWHFPDGMPEAAMDAAIKRAQEERELAFQLRADPPVVAPRPGEPVLTNSPPPFTGAKRYLLGAPAAVGRGLVNALGFPGDLFNLAAETTGKAVAPLRNALGLPPLPSTPEPSWLLPTSQMLRESRLSAPLWDTRLLPEGSGEKYGAAALEGAGGALPAMALGIPPGAALLSGAGGSLAGQAANDVFPGNKLAGLVAGGTVGAFGQNLLTGSQARAAVAGATKKLAAAQEAKTAADQAVLDHAPVVGGAKIAVDDARALAAQRVADAQAALNTAVEHVASVHGTADDFQTAGEIAQQRARAWLAKDLPALVNEAHAPLNAVVPKGTQVPREELMRALVQQTEGGGSNQALIDVLSPKLPKVLKDILTGGEDAAGVAAVPQTWEEAMALRRHIGDTLSNPMIVKDIPAQRLAQLYAAQTADMRAGLGKLPADATTGATPVSLFDAANDASSKLYKFAEGPLSAVVASAKASADDPAAGAVVRRLLSEGKVDGARLAALREQMPDAANEITAAALRQGWWGKLNPQAQEALVPDASHRGLLNGIHVSTENAKDDAGVLLANAQAAAKEEAAKAAALKLAAGQAGLGEREAKNALGAVAQNPTEANRELLRTFLGSTIGAAGGVVGSRLLEEGPDNDLYNGAWGELAGLTVPRLAAQGIGALRNPRMMLLGAQAGMNPARRTGPRVENLPEPEER